MKTHSRASWKWTDRLLTSPSPPDAVETHLHLRVRSTQRGTPRSLTATSATRMNARSPRKTSGLQANLPADTSLTGTRRGGRHLPVDNLRRRNRNLQRERVLLARRPGLEGQQSITTRCVTANSLCCSCFFPWEVATAGTFWYFSALFPRVRVQVFHRDQELL